MIKKNRASRASLFLMELILAILIFSIASAIAISLFYRSHTLSEDATVLNVAVRETSSVAELVRSADTPGEFLQLYVTQYSSEDTMDEAQAFLDHVASESSNVLFLSDFKLFYDADFQGCDEPEAAYVLTGVFDEISTNPSHLTLTFRRMDGADDIYSLEVTHRWKEGARV